MGKATKETELQSSDWESKSFPRPTKHVELTECKDRAYIFSAVEVYCCMSLFLEVK
jgi:hypothetical protein